MFRITKVKVAAGIAAGALTLGAAGAYAAANLNNTLPVSNTTTVDFHGLSLTALPGAPMLPTTPFQNQGDCVSWFAQHKDFALTANGGLTTVNGATRLAKSYHGKLMSKIGDVCKQAALNATKSDAGNETSASETTTGDAADTTGASDNGSAGHGQGHGHGHNGAQRQTGD